MRAWIRLAAGSAVSALLAAGTLISPAGAWAAAPAPVEGTPPLAHVFTIVLENEDLGSTWNTPGTYLHRLLAKGTFATQYYGTSHVSADNYIAMTSGQTPFPTFNGDCLNYGACAEYESARPDGGASVADQLDAAHKTWKAYMDGMAAPCLHPSASATSDPYQSGYATRHDPFVYYPHVAGDQGYCNAHVVPYSQLASDLKSEATTPSYAFISPDTCHDGHDSPCTGADQFSPGGAQGGLTAANAWMSNEVPKILNSPAFTTPGVASVLFITSDEGPNTDATGCTSGSITNGAPGGTCGSGITGTGVDGGGLIGLLAVGSPSAYVDAGKTTGDPYDHASLLRTVEDALLLPSLPGLPPTSDDGSGHLNQAGSPLEAAMAGLFHLVPVLTVAISHAGDFTQGDHGRTYSIQVSNTGIEPTSGAVKLADELPTGLGLVSLAGPGWTCDAGSATCTRSDALSVGSAYPPITVTVDVAANAPQELVNLATASGGGAATASAGDPTRILSGAVGSTGAGGAASRSGSGSPTGRGAGSGSGATLPAGSAISQPVAPPVIPTCGLGAEWRPGPVQPRTIRAVLACAQDTQARLIVTATIISGRGHRAHRRTITIARLTVPVAQQQSKAVSVRLDRHTRATLLAASRAHERVSVVCRLAGFDASAALSL